MRRQCSWDLHGWLGVAVVLMSSATSPALAEPARRPDVLFIAVDDLNDWIGCLGGHPQAKTPNLDRLAARSSLFTNAHCVAPACNPSRVALLTSRRPSSTGVYANGDAITPDPAVITMPQFFKKHGYRVMGCGKIFHGSDGNSAFWDDFHRPKPPKDIELHNANGLNRGHFDWGPFTGGENALIDGHNVSHAQDVLRRPPAEPLFLAVGLVKPHLPWFVPQPYFDLFPRDAIRLPEVLANDLDDIPAAGRRMANPGGDHAAVINAKQWPDAVRGYLAAIAYCDAQVGRLLKALDEAPRRENTIVVLWGDHGWHLGEKQHWRKFALWEEATRAPLMLLAPGVTKPNTRVTQPVDFLTVLPTLADLCGLPADADWEGISARPLLVDPSARWDRVAITTHGRGNHAVRDARWRYIRYASGEEELYDHQSDPLEWRNLADRPEHASLKREMAGRPPVKEVARRPPDPQARPRAKNKRAKKANS